MNLWALDAGSAQSALVSFDGHTLYYAKVLPNDKLLALVRNSIDALRGRRFVIERVESYGMPVGREVFDTCTFYGRVAEAAEANGAVVDYVGRKAVKIHLCGTSKANDSNVRQALLDAYPPEIMSVMRNTDLRSALSVAHWALTNRSN